VVVTNIKVETTATIVREKEDCCVRFEFRYVDVLWDVTPCSPVDNDISDELADSIFRVE
jgi:hypothetical protein